MKENKTKDYEDMKLTKKINKIPIAYIFTLEAIMEAVFIRLS